MVQRSARDWIAEVVALVSAVAGVAGWFGLDHGRLMEWSPAPGSALPSVVYAAVLIFVCAITYRAFRWRRSARRPDQISPLEAFRLSPGAGRVVAELIQAQSTLADAERVYAVFRTTKGRTDEYCAGFALAALARKLGRQDREDALLFEMGFLCAQRGDESALNQAESEFYQVEGKT